MDRDSERWAVDGWIQWIGDDGRTVDGWIQWIGDDERTVDGRRWTVTDEVEWKKVGNSLGLCHRELFVQRPSASYSLHLFDFPWPVVFSLTVRYSPGTAI